MKASQHVGHFSGHTISSCMLEDSDVHGHPESPASARRLPSGQYLTTGGARWVDVSRSHRDTFLVLKLGHPVSAIMGAYAHA